MAGRGVSKLTIPSGFLAQGGKTFGQKRESPSGNTLADDVFYVLMGR